MKDLLVCCYISKIIYCCLQFILNCLLPFLCFFHFILLKQITLEPYKLNSQGIFQGKQEVQVSTRLMLAVLVLNFKLPAKH